MARSRMFIAELLPFRCMDRPAARDIPQKILNSRRSAPAG